VEGALVVTHSSLVQWGAKRLYSGYQSGEPASLVMVRLHLAGAGELKNAAVFVCSLLFAINVRIKPADRKALSTTAAQSNPVSVDWQQIPVVRLVRYPTTDPAADL